MPNLMDLYNIGRVVFPTQQDRLATEYARMQRQNLGTLSPQQVMAPFTQQDAGNQQTLGQAGLLNAQAGGLNEQTGQSRSDFNRLGMSTGLYDMINRNAIANRGLDVTSRGQDVNKSISQDQNRTQRGVARQTNRSQERISEGTNKSRVQAAALGTMPPYNYPGMEQNPWLQQMVEQMTGMSFRQPAPAAPNPDIAAAQGLFQGKGQPAPEQPERITSKPFKPEYTPPLTNPNMVAPGGTMPGSLPGGANMFRGVRNWFLPEYEKMYGGAQQQQTAPQQEQRQSIQAPAPARPVQPQLPGRSVTPIVEDLPFGGQTTATNPTQLPQGGFSIDQLMALLNAMGVQL